MRQKEQDKKVKEDTTSSPESGDTSSQLKEIESLAKELRYRVADTTTSEQVTIEEHLDSDKAFRLHGWHTRIQGTPESVLKELQDETTNKKHAKELGQQKGYRVYEYNNRWMAAPNSNIEYLRKIAPVEIITTEKTSGQIQHILDWLENEAPDLSKEKVLTGVAEAFSLRYLVWHDPETGNCNAHRKTLGNKSDDSTIIHYTAETPQALFELLEDAEEFHDQMKEVADKKGYRVSRDKTGSWNAKPSFDVINARKKKGKGSIRQRKAAAKKIPLDQQKVGSDQEVLAWLKNEAPDLSNEIAA